MKKSSITISCVLGICLACASLFLLVYIKQHKVVNTPSIEESSPIAFESANDSSIDWDYWLSVNPDIVAWIILPDSNINQPIVKAPANSPQYYLTHDVYKEKNAWGAVYLDYECDLATSKNAIIAGHNMDDQSMFADLEYMADKNYAQSHQIFYLYLPYQDAPKTLQLCSIKIAGFSNIRVRTEFLDSGDFAQYLSEIQSSARQNLQTLDSTKQLFTLYTCSYNYSNNERTVCYLQEKN